MNIARSVLKIALLAITIYPAVSVAQAQQVHVNVTNIESNKGQILVAVFKDQQSFKSEKPAFKHRFPKAAVSQGTLKISFDVPAGTYGLALVDDENGNGKMDKNVVGFPKEAVGFSNFYLSGMSKPSFNDFKFEVQGTSVTVQCKFRNF